MAGGSSLGRLRKGREFDRVYSEGTVIGGPLFVLRYRANGLDTSRWGFAVGKKLAPKAVERNLQRRRLREMVRGLDPAAVGVDVVVAARGKLLECKFAKAESEMRRMVDLIPAGGGRN